MPLDSKQVVSQRRAERPRDGRWQRGRGEGHISPQSSVSRGNIQRMVCRHFSLLGLLLAACAIPNTIEGLDRRSPPPEFGRPVWVRVFAGTGGWLGGIVGGAVSIVLLPVTYPVSLLAGDGLGEHAASEFLLFPALTGAALGHCLLGAPPDLLDYTFRRAWFSSPDPAMTYELVPLEGPKVPLVEGAAAQGGKSGD